MTQRIEDMLDGVNEPQERTVTKKSNK